MLGEPQISAPGLFELGDAEPAIIAGELRRTIAELLAALRREDEAARGGAIRASQGDRAAVAQAADGRGASAAAVRSGQGRPPQRHQGTSRPR